MQDTIIVLKRRGDLAFNRLQACMSHYYFCKHIKTLDSTRLQGVLFKIQNYLQIEWNEAYVCLPAVMWLGKADGTTDGRTDQHTHRPKNTHMHICPRMSPFFCPVTHYFITSPLRVCSIPCDIQSSILSVLRISCPLCLKDVLLFRVTFSLMLFSAVICLILLLHTSIVFLVIWSQFLFVNVYEYVFNN